MLWSKFKFSSIQSLPCLAWVPPTSCLNTYRPFRHGTFRQESFRHGCFITGTFRHMHHSALRTFRQMDFSTPERFNMGNFRHGEFSARGIFCTWSFRHRDISAPEPFGTWIFWHLANQYGRFGTDILALVLLCRNVHMPKCSHSEMFLCRKILVTKIPHVEMLPCWNVHLPESLQCRMVHMPKCSCDETFMSKWLLPKSQVSKWWKAPNSNYSTRAIISRALFTFYSLFEVYLYTVTFGLMYG